MVTLLSNTEWNCYLAKAYIQDKISLNKYVEVTSTNAAKIFGMFPKKGTIGVGADADLVLFDPHERHTLSAKTHHMNTDYSVTKVGR